MGYQRKKWHMEWDKKKAEIREQIAERNLSKEYEPELIYAALLEYLYRDLNKDFRTEFGEKLEDSSD